ncbi:hypothetical protein MFLAVUS_001159 [Mucor flavus]|uniref:Protein MIS12 homolog n=1 Tax=Mucor flavus TaxID=439312 RepID=A0ABP9YLN5_9FUNG
MEPHTYSDQELLSDLFGFLPTRLTDRLYDIMNACVYNIFDGITEKLTSTRPDKEFEIAEALRSFEKRVEMDLDAAFNTFQDYLLGSVLAVPRTIDIRYDDITGIRTDLTQAHEDALDESLEALRKKIIAQKRLNHFLKKKVDSMQGELSSMDEYSQILSFLSQVPEKHNVIDIEFSTENIILKASNQKREHCK